MAGFDNLYGTLYRNDGTAGFTNFLPQNTFINPSYNPSGNIHYYYLTAEFGDYDNDADLDLLVVWPTLAILYENKGSLGFFTSWSYARNNYCSVSFSDHNNDGFLDILISSSYHPMEIDTNTLAFDTNSTIQVYENGTFRNISSLPPNIHYSGFPNTYQYLSSGTIPPFYYSDNKIFVDSYGIILQNDKQKGFFKSSNLPAYLVNGFSSYGDYNNDGYKDMFILGYEFPTIMKGKDEKLCLTGYYPSTDGSTYYGNACVSVTHDYNIMKNGNVTGKATLLNNEGKNNQIVLSSNQIIPTYSYHNRTNNSFGDIDNDGDLDILVSTNNYTKIYINNSAIKNTPPEQVNGLIASVYGAGKVAFAWQNSQDAQLADSLSRKAHNGIDYNMYFGTTANKNSIRSAESHLDDGYRKISERGMIQGNIYKLENIPNGSYVWSIQAIDQALTGGAWGIEQTINLQNRTLFQSITFHSLAEKTFGDAPFTIAATATSGFPVSFFSTNPNVANVIGNTVNIVGAGEANIIAIQTGNSQYYAAYPVEQLLKIKKRSQTITFQVILTQTIGVPFVLNASSTSLLPIQFSLPNSSYTFLQSNTVTIYQSGTFTVTTFQNGNLDTNPALSVSQVVTVKAHQTISFFKISEKTYSDLPFVLQSRSSSSLAVSYSSASTKVTIDSSIIGINAVGTAAIVAFSNGSNNFFPTHTTQILTIKKARQSITFDIPLSKTLGDADSIIVLNATASSSLHVTFNVYNGSSVQQNGNSITIKLSGVVTIQAIQSGNEFYEPVTVFRNLTVIDANKSLQTIDFAPIPNDTLLSLQDSVSFALTADASSSLPIQFVVENNNDTLLHNFYITQSPGIYTITAFQNGNATVNPAIPVSQIVTVKRKQRIVFPEIPQKNYESAPFFISPYSTSGLEVRSSLANDSIITLDPDYLVTIKNVGTVGITAKQRGNDEYYATDSITRILVVTKADQYFVFKPIPSKIYEDPPILLPATTNAGLNIMYSSASNLINIKEDTLQIIAGGGLVRITAYNTGNKFYQPLAPVSRTFSISKAQQSIHFPKILNKIYGDAPIILDSISNKNLSITYTSSNENVLRIEKNTASILRAGSTTLSATVPENSQYFGESQMQTVLISPAAQVVTFPELPIVYVHERTFVLNATSTNTLPILYASSNPNIAYITGNTVFLQSFGNVHITASQDSVQNYYYASNPETRLLTIKDRTAVENTITFPLEEIQYVGDTVLLEATSSKNLPVSFEIVNNRNGASQNIAYFDKNSQKITFLDTGVFEIKAYTDAFLSREVKVNPAVLIKTIRVKVTYNISGRVLGAEN